MKSFYSFCCFGDRAIRLVESFCATSDILQLKVLLIRISSS